MKASSSVLPLTREDNRHADPARGLRGLPRSRSIGAVDRDSRCGRHVHDVTPGRLRIVSRPRARGPKKSISIVSGADHAPSARRDALRPRFGRDRRSRAVAQLVGFLDVVRRQEQRHPALPSDPGSSATWRAWRPGPDRSWARRGTECAAGASGPRDLEPRAACRPRTCPRDCRATRSDRRPPAALHRLHPCRLGHAVQPGEKVEILGRREVGIGGQRLWDDTNRPPDGVGIVPESWPARSRRQRWARSGSSASGSAWTCPRRSDRAGRNSSLLARRRSRRGRRRNHRTACGAPASEWRSIRSGTVGCPRRWRRCGARRGNVHEHGHPGVQMAVGVRQRHPDAEGAYITLVATHVALRGELPLRTR